MTSKENPSGNIGTGVLQETDRVKVWELKLEPGESSEWHAHQNLYVFVVVEGGRLHAEYADGGSGESDSRPGDYSINQPSTHRVTNTGSTTYRNIIVEIKGS